MSATTRDLPIAPGTVAPLPGSAAPVLNGSTLLVVGGQQRSDRSAFELDRRWYGYGRALVVELGPDGARTALSHISSLDTRSPDGPVLFKQASRVDDRLYLCTPTEVLVVSLPDYRIEAHISLPCFNDLHHVVPSPWGTLFVANSGLEMVLELDLGSSIVRAWNVLGEGPWERASSAIDFRMGVDLRPHRAHPNHVFFVDDEPWVTRFELRDAISLDDPGRRMAIGLERVHDGVVRDGRIYFTTVDGKVAVVDRETLELVDVLTLDLRTNAQAGWCRGLHFGDAEAWVGFSRIRYTRFRNRLSWVRSGVAERLPTCVARFSLPTWTSLGWIDLEPFGINAVFSVIDGGGLPPSR